VGDLPPQLVGYMQPHVTQRELFIRAATEGRRDHVYQSCMFDPLTAATLTLDQIVEMCDELIAAHGDVLPPLTTRTLVRGSGKSFAPPTPRELRASWDAAQPRAVEDFITHWQVIGPFRSDAEEISLDFTTPVEHGWPEHGAAAVDLGMIYKYDGQTLRWREAVAGEQGFVNLAEICGRAEWAVAYAYTEMTETHARETVLKCGSDDGIKIWLNGKLVHEREAQRAYRPGSDEAPIYLVEGVNRILVKVNNYQAGWGFGVAVPRANF
jgi:Family 4 glycosyl hydrolase C-terminal domain